jgi:hypothetical protein
MKNELMQAALATWGARELPARLAVSETSKLLGFAEHDIQILMAAGKLEPLGDPAPNAPKWFAAVEVIQLASDREWLHKATKEISKYWRNKRERRTVPRSCSRSGRHDTVQFAGEKVSPDSSPKSSPEGRIAGGNGAMHSVERATEKAA